MNQEISQKINPKTSQGVRINPKAFHNARINKKKFIITWFMAFCVLFTTASVLGLVPEPDESDKDLAITPEALALEDQQDEVSPEIPLRVEAPSIGLNTPVLNPESTDIDFLDNELTKGVVRYPGSGLAGEENANMFIFGHSSHLAVVRNKAYQAFNDIEKLSKGDEIVVYGKESKFIYKVVSVEEAKASDAWVDFKSDKSMLTLSTCNTFGDLGQDRFVVKAELSEVESQ